MRNVNKKIEQGNGMRIKVKLFKMEQKKTPGCELLAAFLFLGNALR